MKLSLYNLNNWNKSEIYIMVKSSKVDGTWMGVLYILKSEVGDVVKRNGYLSSKMLVYFHSWTMCPLLGLQACKLY